MKSQRLLAISFALALVPSVSAQVTTTSPQIPPPTTQSPPPHAQVPQSQTQGPLPNEKASSKPTGQYNAPTNEEKKPVVIPDRKLTAPDRVELIRGMTAELGFARKPFPMGKTGLTLNAHTGVITPAGQQLDAMMAGYGPALKPGDRARITDLKFKDKSIIFEINGGPAKKKKWYEHIQVSGMGGTVQPGQPTDDTNVRGSFVELAFEKFVPDLKPDEVKRLLDPVVNFHAKSATEAYMETIPPQAKVAIRDHQALVGMNREMVTYAKGRPPQKHREKDGDVEYEEWIYGTPPQNVEFIRFVSDEVIRIETMKVDGTKVVRTDREVVLKKEEPEVAQGAPVPGHPPTGDQPAAQPRPAATTQDADDGPKGRPSLKRPGEETQQQPAATKPQRVPQQPPIGGPDKTIPKPPGP
jgi:hypothetical protein